MRRAIQVVLAGILTLSVHRTLAAPSDYVRGIVQQAEALGFHDPSALMAACGKPDIDDSTQYDKPRPPMVTRWLKYKQAAVTAVYLADAQPGTPPPYERWKLISVNDDRTKAVITLQEFIGRLGCRNKK